MHEHTHRLIAVTGASGFIGNVLLRQLLTEGYIVRVLTREPEKFLDIESVDVYVGDLVEKRDWTAFLDGVDVLVHVAAEIRRAEVMMAVNVEGPERLLKAAMAVGVRRWVQLSSVGAYGPTVLGLVDETTPENPEGHYEKTKTIFDQRLRIAAANGGLEICIVRPSNVYGSDMVNQSLFKMMRMIKRGWFSYIGPEGSSANYVHVNDVVKALVLCVKLPQAAGKTYNVSDWDTIENMVQAMARGMKVGVPNRRFRLGLMFICAILFQWIPRWPLTIARVKALSSCVRYSTQAIEKDLGWSVTVPIVSGMLELSSEVK